MDCQISALQKARASYQPKLPPALRAGNVKVVLGAPTESASDQEEIKKLFPHTYGQPVATLAEGDGSLSTAPLKVGVVLSGGQAPGGHNVIAGLFDALKAANPESRLFGFLKGPGGIIKGKYKELTSDVIDRYRNTGGFDMIMSGRDKIEKPEDLAACKANLEQMGLDGLVIVGGDDSNTNAALLAEYLRAQDCPTCVIGVPKTIDGDMKNAQIETSFGFDTAAKTYSELIGNIERDATSAVKYWHFIRLMGRAASHVTLECALQTHPNITLISEEVQAKGTTLAEIVDYIVDVVVKRAAAGKNYGVLLVPEGLVEFIPDIKVMIDELSTILGRDEQYLRSLPDHSERAQYLNTQLTAESAQVYNSLPVAIQEVLLTRDSHGNVPLSQVETERLLIDLVSDKIRLMKARGETEAKFSPLSHFFGYEGRCAAPSNFDADYTYSLGYAAAHLIRGGLTGYTVNVQNVTKPVDQWVAGGTPVTMMLNLEKRKGKMVPVIKKALVDLDGKPFKVFAENRDKWALEDHYIFPGPIQYFGPAEVCDAPTMTLALEKK
ncbi:MAG TPA: diphosphate--fructose-6-phosphate 1-phosphotransferase [Armatimonadota bacterium]|nr:diphosphate--fructose-6-phosphate 1-phosphotransferase [Armatimonadota bacterium]HOM81750.1 diphosphate--fructose-6-phosphate 1-phosphotransferase [Armatimonadota bacterium]HPO71811.1 diphosphate--fructose-6-phosphate 1-phosphotransferase [Armatimonadota bacterium]HPT97126.1 diphosphate--fructose-6-phosphate 1-phosphotransferase [Armatimonadota bacterium]